MTSTSVTGRGAVHNPYRNVVEVNPGGQNEVDQEHLHSVSSHECSQESRTLSGTTNILIIG